METQVTRRSAYFNALVYSIFLISGKMNVFCTFITCLLFRKSLNAKGTYAIENLFYTFNAHIDLPCIPNNRTVRQCPCQYWIVFLSNHFFSSWDYCVDTIKVSHRYRLVFKNIHRSITTKFDYLLLDSIEHIWDRCCNRIGKYMVFPHDYLLFRFTHLLYYGDNGLYWDIPLSQKTGSHM